MRINDMGGERSFMGDIQNAFASITNVGTGLRREYRNRNEAGVTAIFLRGVGYSRRPAR